MLYKTTFKKNLFLISNFIQNITLVTVELPIYMRLLPAIRKMHFSLVKNIFHHCLLAFVSFFFFTVREKSLFAEGIMLD